jgi:hypothetical protein
VDREGSGQVGPTVGGRDGGVRRAVFGGQAGGAQPGGYGSPTGGDHGPEE